MGAFVTSVTLIGVGNGRLKRDSLSSRHARVRLRNAGYTTPMRMLSKEEGFPELPPLDIASLGNNITLGEDFPRDDTVAKKKNRDSESEWSMESEGVYSVSHTIRQRGRSENKKPLTVAQQRALLRDQSVEKSRSDRDFLQAARDAIALAGLSHDAAGIADVTTNAEFSGNDETISQPVVTSNGRAASVKNGIQNQKPRQNISVSDKSKRSDVVLTKEKLKSVSKDRAKETHSKPSSGDWNYDVSIVANAAESSENQTANHSPSHGININQEPDFVIRPGNLVMHSRFGVGRFRGLETISSMEGPRQEFAVVEYRDRDMYISLLQLENMRRLTIQERKNVKALDAVSISATNKGMSLARNARHRRAKFSAKVKARQHIRQQLVNLHALYASRDVVKREPYPPHLDTEAQFANQCDFQLTQDQQVAAQEILSDITERPHPMDRLLCGDVGFGKTEVALRCAFRILMSGKQVAVLAPTTILAQQHFETFRDRLKSHFPEFLVVCLTRFASKSLAAENRRMISSGKAKLVVGTHTLLSKTVEFKELGLLIVDEEHRFGVNQKEKLRCKYQNVDSLFMSATPIPRTLHLALSGLRDVSILKTPPPGRKPVITRIAATGAGVIRKAISFELERDGQVFFVCPRIEGIEVMAQNIREMFPSIKVLVAHGSHKDLEERIWAFANGQYDVLVCTSIIENGINMPRVNTLVVQDALRFGMAQLHQLRGRVGRCNLQAYAWMLHGALGGDTASGYERLESLQRYSGLGAGFAIAKRDMEMRGVGTVLGVDQHGNSSLDPDEYSKVLVEELSSMKTGKPVPLSLPAPVSRAETSLPVASYIPSEYISNLDEKMTAYSMISNAKSAKDLIKVAEDIKRRYGQFPAPLQMHFAVVRLKLLAQRLGIRRVFAERNHVVLDWPISARALQRLVTFLDDEQGKKRFELVEEEEIVNLRGLGICTGEVQLAKLLKWFGTFVKTSVQINKNLPDIENEELGPSGLVKTFTSSKVN